MSGATQRTPTMGPKDFKLDPNEVPASGCSEKGHGAVPVGTGHLPMALKFARHVSSSEGTRLRARLAAWAFELAWRESPGGSYGTGYWCKLGPRPEPSAEYFRTVPGVVPALLSVFLVSCPGRRHRDAQGISKQATRTLSIKFKAARAAPRS